MSALLESKNFIWLVAQVLLIWYVVHWAVFKLLGVSVGIIDPLRLRVRSIRFRDFLSIRFVYYSFRNRGLVIHGMTLNWPQEEQIKSSAKSSQESPKNYLSIPRWAQWLLIRFVRVFRRYTVVLENMEIDGVTVENVTMTLMFDDERLEVSILVKDAAMGDVAKCSGIFFELSGKLNFQRPVVPLEDLVSDIKVRGVSVSYEQLQAYLESVKKSQKSEDEGNDEIFDFAVDGSPNSETAMCIQYIKYHLLKISDAVAMVKKVSFVADNFTVSNIPFTRHPALTDTGKLLKFEISTSNLTLVLNKLDETAPGFKLNFSPDEFPLNIKCTLSSIAFKINQAFTDLECYQFCEIPSIAIYGDTNLFSLRLIEENFEEPVETVAKLVGHVSSPIVDFEIAQYSFLKSFKDHMKVFQLLLQETQVEKPTCAKTLEKKQAIFTYFQHILPLVESKITIEDPTLLVSDGSELLVQKCSILSVITKADKFIVGGNSGKGQVHYNLKNTLEIMNYNFNYHNKLKKYIHKILTISNISVASMAHLVPNIRVNCYAGVDVCELDLSELSTLMSLNNIFRKANSKMLLVEEEQFENLYKKFSEFLEFKKQESVLKGISMKQTEVCPKEQLFENLPPFFDGLRANIQGLKVTVGARSVFMSKDIFANLKAQSAEDLVDGELRKLSHSIEKIQISLVGSNEQPRMSDDQNSDASTLLNSTKAFSYDEFGLEDSASSLSPEKDHVWLFRCSVFDMLTTLYSEKRTERQTLHAKTVFKLPILDVSLFPDCPSIDQGEKASSKIIVSISTGECEAMISLMSVFLVLSAAHTFKETFTRDVNRHRRESKAKEHLSAQYTKKKQRGFLARLLKKELLELLQFELNSKSLSTVIILPNGVKTRLDVFRTTMAFSNIYDIKTQGHFLRFCVESPQVPNSWVRMITCVNFRAEGNIKRISSQILNPTKETQEPSVLLYNDTLNFNIPHGFEMYQIFDNISTTAKSIKQMLYSLKTSSTECVMYPKVSSPICLPGINLKSRRWVFGVEDDAFESQLAMIFQVGLDEQRSRLEKYDVFEKALAKELLERHNNMKRTETTFLGPEKHHLGDRKSNELHRMRRNSVPEISRSESMNQDHYHYAEDAEVHIEEYHRLQEQISASWIRRIQAFKKREQIEFQRNFEYVWGKVDPECFPNGINKKILAFVSSPPLMNLIIEDANVTIAQPHFGIQNYQAFIHDVGKGVPKDTEYSILVPMHLNAEFREIRCHLRDYPLPFVYLPDLTSRQQELGCERPVRLHGDIIISEDKIRSDRELRTLFVPLVPSATLENDDRLYSLLVPRTLTAIKTYTKLNLELNSEETTFVTWNGSYSPAIQQVMQCFDNFSKPPIDPSPKLGFWDKVREIFHARISIRWNNNGQLNVALKGGRSPYNMGGEAAGFVVGLKGNLNVGCNIADDPKKFLSLNSEEVFFSIPNFFAKPLLSWSRSSSDCFFFPSHDNTNLQQFAFYYNLIDLPKVNMDAHNIRVMAGSYFEKTAIRLTGGITLNVGIVFERIKHDSKKRTFESQSHWNTRLCNPVVIEDLETHDSYKGFRSEFIHLSFTLLSSNPKAYNVLQLTPGVFKIFFGWWHTFSGNLPVRRGPLFGMNAMSPKFGVHLYTISYHADVAPLFISHIHELFDPDENMSKSQKHSTNFVGLKAKSEHFMMDLHQRKEVLHEYKHELRTTKRISKLAFNEGYVSNIGIDVRTVQAQFAEAQSLEDSKESYFDVFDNDMTWFDPTDYKEVFLDSIQDRSYEVHINSLVYAPKFVYKKHSSYGDKYQVDFESCEKIEPFDNADYHDCTLKTSVKTPLNLIETRLLTLQTKLSEVTNEIDEVNVRNDKEKVHFLELKQRKVEAAIEQVRKVLDDFNEYEKYENGHQDEDEISEPECSSASERGKINDCAEYEWLTRKSFSNSFEHRFFIFSMFMKWNDVNRDAVYSYIHLLDYNRELAYICNHKAVRKVFDPEEESKKQSNEKHDSISDAASNSTDMLQSETVKSLDARENILEVFEEGLRSLNVDFNFTTRDNHLVQFVAPQIQLTTTSKPDVCTLITAPSIKLKTVGFDTNVTQNQYNSDIFMNRYSVALLKANVFVFHRDNFSDYHDVFFSEDGYDQSSERNWQPWPGIELCFNPAPLEKDALIQDLSAIFRFDRMFSFANIAGVREPNLKNKMICQLPRTIVSSNSRQYLALYDVVAHLLVYVEPKSAHLRKEIEKLMLRYDTTNLAPLKKVVIELQLKVVALNHLEKELAFRRNILEADGLDDLRVIRKNKYESLISLYILMKVLNMGSQEHAAEDQKVLWDLEAKEIIIHMLHDDGTPFLDVALAKSYFQRVESSYGYNSNKVVIGMAQIFNLDRDVLFHHLLGPSEPKEKKKWQAEDSKPLIVLEWDIEKPIGGMKVIRKAVTNFRGLDVNVEQETLTKIIQWAFPAEVEQFMQDSNTSYTTDDDLEDGAESALSGQQSFTIGKIGEERNAQEDPHDVDEMFKRSSDYMVITNMIVNSFKLKISYRGTGAMRLINVTHFGFLFPRLTIHNQTITSMELMVMIKQVLLKSLFKHAGNFLGNKLKRHTVHNDAGTSPLRQLSSYHSYTKAEDLRDHDSIKSDIGLESESGREVWNGRDAERSLSPSLEQRARKGERRGP
ncbi:LADA_0E03884g1_1 [Lachancea dasiensis]|uniref:LADA_0E03884g1_1 n=1 Tax=Lachancea dasiensis TaxID=1072105 RepID=A0A1G4JBK7_9SACH|nr:LADA_0E03884g1_1 [Lachancea dasiensis]